MLQLLAQYDASIDLPLPLHKTNVTIATAPIEGAKMLGRLRGVDCQFAKSTVSGPRLGALQQCHTKPRSLILGRNGQLVRTRDTLARKVLARRIGIRWLDHDCSN